MNNVNEGSMYIYAVIYWTGSIYWYPLVYYSLEYLVKMQY